MRRPARPAARETLGARVWVGRAPIRSRRCSEHHAAMRHAARRSPVRATTGGAERASTSPKKHEPRTITSVEAPALQNERARGSWREARARELMPQAHGSRASSRPRASLARCAPALALTSSACCAGERYELRMRRRCGHRARRVTCGPTARPPRHEYGARRAVIVILEPRKVTAEGRALPDERR